MRLYVIKADGNSAGFLIICKLDLGFSLQLEGIVAKVLNLKAVSLVLFIVEGIELIASELVELVEVGPPLPVGTEVSAEVSLYDVDSHGGSYVESTHSQNVYTVTGDSAASSGNRLNNACVNAGALTCSNVNTHTGAAEQKSTIEFLLGDGCTNTETNAVEHKIGIFNGGISYTVIGYFPALLLKMSDYCFFEGIACKVSTNDNLFVFNRFHDFYFLSVFFVDIRLSHFKRFVNSNFNKV